MKIFDIDHWKDSLYSKNAIFPQNIYKYHKLDLPISFRSSWENLGHTDEV